MSRASRSSPLLDLVFPQQFTDSDTRPFAFIPTEILEFDFTLVMVTGPLLDLHFDVVAPGFECVVTKWPRLAVDQQL